MRLYYLKNRDKLKKAANDYYYKNKEKQVRSKEYHKRTYVPVPPELHKKRGAVREDGMRSGFERTLANQLNAAQIKFDYETLGLDYTLDGTYWPDFILPNGIIIEAKGLLDKESKRKMLAVKRQHPDKDVRIVFMVADKNIPGSKTTHGQWATKNGFKWADGEIPEDWIQEALEERVSDG